jgi:hypothetical protein
MGVIAFRPRAPLIMENHYKQLLPRYTIYCKKEEIDSLHRHTCRKLGIENIYNELRWNFNDRLRAVLGQAEFWEDEADKKQWKIQYATKYWIPMGIAARRNIIVHEVCHLAVEKKYGHCAKPKQGETQVKDHGWQWQKLMHRCGEEPFLNICC